MSGGAAVCDELNDPFLGVPAVAGGMHPAVKDLRRVRTAVDVHMDGILLGRIKVFGIVDDARELQAVGRCDGNQLPGGAVIASLAGDELGPALQIVQPHFPGGLKVGRPGDKMLAVGGKGGV